MKEKAKESVSKGWDEKTSLEGQLYGMLGTAPKVLQSIATQVYSQFRNIRMCGFRSCPEWV